MKFSLWPELLSVTEACMKWKKKTIGKKVNRNVSTSLGWDDITQTQALYNLPPLSLRRDETGDKGNRAWDQGWFIPWYWNKHKHLLLFSHIIQESWSPWYLGVKSGQFIPLKSPTCMKESAWRLPTFKQTSWSQICAFLGWHFL